MRLTPAFLAVSITANLGLGYLVWSGPSHAADHSASAPARATADATASAPLASADDDAKTHAAQAAAFTRFLTGDLATEVARLRELGLPKDMIEDMAQAAVFAKYRKAMRSFPDDFSMGAMWGNTAKTARQREQIKKFRELTRQIGEEASAAGVDWNMFSMMGPKAPIPEDKAAKVSRLEQDRLEMSSNIQMDAGGLMLERDTAQLKYIEEEYEKELAALLTPEELEAWNLTRSQTAQNLRSRVSFMNPSAEEFALLYKYQAAFDKDWGTSYMGHNTDWQKRSEAEQKMREQIKAALGPERYADYQKATDSDYGTLNNLEYRLELPAGTADRLLASRQEAERAAAKIRGDKSLSDADRKASLQVLAEQAKTEFTTTLGEEGFNAYRKQGPDWLENLAR